jgi:PAS domain S-box-containing protein
MTFSSARILAGLRGSDAAWCATKRGVALAVIPWLSPAKAHAMPSADVGSVETGAPSFVVLGPEALGLSSSPSDMHLLPDGRILVVSQNELAFGDGVRWQAFHGAAGQSPILGSVAVDDDGQIYTGTTGGAGRIDLIEGSRWRLTRMKTFPDNSQNAFVSVTTFPDRWLWYGGDGAIVSWRPSQTPTIVGKAGAVERIFMLGENAYVSDRASGGLFLLKSDGTSESVLGGDSLVSEEVTCAISFGKGQLLVGTGSAGLKIFDGKHFRAFGPRGWPSVGHRVTDLCEIGQGLFAAAIDATGIVFFDREGRTVQVLERSLDHRLSRVRRLAYSGSGVLWALLNDGLARVEFPSPISHFEPLIAGGLAYAQPLRHAGELWILADGRAAHAVYDQFGRLDHFTDETPPGQYLFTMANVGDELFACNDGGIFVYESKGWRLALPGIVNARVGVALSTDGKVYYVADGEYGTIQKIGQTYSARRIRMPELADSYGATIDAAGIGWLELGLNKVGRLDANGGNPILKILGRDDGLFEGWAEVYVLDGIARFHLGHELFRYDDARQKFVKDVELLKQLPQLAVAGGRPVTDASGRLWYTAEGAAQYVDLRAAGNLPVRIPSAGFAPTSYTAEDGGVIWMFENRHLARLDPKVPPRPVAPLRAIITSVQLSASNRQLFDTRATMEPLEFSDNSLIINFAAPADPFASPVTFEVQLEGSESNWVSTGAVGSATFYRLKEGNYVFHVRPVSGAGTPGIEDSWRFRILPPWYRTRLSWVAYVLATFGLFAAVTWLSSFLQRRENERLERVVAKRTNELNAINAQLGRQIEETTEKSAALSTSEERYRLLNTKLEERVERRTAQVSQSNEELQKRESLFRLIFEHAPVGISWMRADLGDMYHINPTFSRILELPGGTLSDFSHLTGLVHPKDMQRHAEKSRLIASGGLDSYSIEERFAVPSGRLVWAMYSVAVIRDDKGRIIQEIGILEDITQRKKTEDELAVTHKNLVDTSRQAGMAEVATGVLHNVGNVLNSVNVSATLVADFIRHSKTVNIGKLSALFEQNKSDLGSFITKDERGKLIPGYLATLSESLSEERKSTISELDNLRKNIEHIKEIVAMQQSYARTSGVIETISVPDMIEDTLRIHAGGLARHDIETFRDYQVRPVVTTDKHKVMQILINLVRNAKYACDESGRIDKKITVRTTSDERFVQIAIIDNGVGIPSENLTRIFNHGFTTRASGHGFGLHSGALAAKELGGSLRVVSPGVNFGATFVLELPFKSSTQANELLNS